MNNASFSLFIPIPLLFFVLCFFVSSSLQSQLNVWPKPRTISWPNPQATLLSPTFTINSPAHPHLSAAVTRYLSLILTEHHQPLVTPAVNITASSPPLKNLIITVAQLTTPLQHGVDESYTLTIPTVDGFANLTAETVWGAMRGLETFSQLVWGEPSRVAVGVSVWDAPIFGHRGVMLDTSRNYYEVEDILRTIGGMSANKLNVFHWHITDSHSFPLVLPSEPDLAGKGSYGPDMQYSPTDVNRLCSLVWNTGLGFCPRSTHLETMSQIPAGTPEDSAREQALQAITGGPSHGRIPLQGLLPPSMVVLKQKAALADSAMAAIEKANRDAADSLIFLN